MNIRNLSMLLIASLLSWMHTYSQDKVVLNVVYEFSYVRDLSARNMPYKTNMVLSLGKSSSRYGTENVYNSKMKKNVEKKAVISSAPKPTVTVAGGPLLIVSKYGAVINEEIIKDIDREKMNVYATMGFKTYNVRADIPKIAWQIHPDKKMIGKYNCQKATGACGGRTYTAWFSPDLPFRDGPWRLSGLPGLILEAQDEKNEISFVFKEMNRSGGEETTTSFLANDNCIRTNMKSYLKTKAAFEKDPESIMAAMAPNARVAVRNLDNPKDKTARKVKKYNPIELN